VIAPIACAQPGEYCSTTSIVYLPLTTFDTGHLPTAVSVRAS
jgi:hypothetical protein